MKNLDRISPKNIHLGMILDGEIQKSLSQEEVNDLIKLLILYNKPENIENYLFKLKTSVNSLFEKLITSIINFQLENSEFYSKIEEKEQLNQEQTLTISEICSLMNVSRPTLDKWFDMGLTKLKVGKRVYVFKSDLDKFLKNNSLKN